MSALLKSGLRQEVRRFAGAPESEGSRTAPAAIPDPRDAELARLSAEVARLERMCAEGADATARAVETAWEEGHGKGVAEAATREADRLAMLEKALRESAASFSTRLDALDALAPALARAALAKLFAEPENWAAPVEAMLARQLAALRRAALIAVRVSPRDFTDAEALAALSEALGIDGVSLETDRELRAGASRIECRLGHVDLDLREQWQTLCSLLEEMAE